jgi:hypothetical protein
VNEHLLTRRRRLNYTLALGDVVLTTLALGLAYGLLGIAGAASVDPSDVVEKLASVGWIFVASQVSALYVLGLYTPRKAIDWRTTGQLALAISLGTALTSGMLFFVPGFVVGRQPLLLTAPLLFGLLFAWRYAVFRKGSREAGRARLALAGGEHAVRGVIEDVARQSHPDYVVVRAYLADADRDRGDEKAPESAPPVERTDDFEKLVNAGDVQAIAVDLQGRWLQQAQVERLLELSFQGVEIHDLGTLHKNLTGRVPREGVDGRTLLANVGTRIASRGAYWRAKRLVDIGFATAGLVVAALPMLAVAVAVKATSRGPVFFVQERLGYRRRSFRCIKFRTMVDDAERETGPVWAGERDPRITAVGEFLRKSRLDELPQLWNVLRGDMALVGHPVCDASRSHRVGAGQPELHPFGGGSGSQVPLRALLSRKFLAGHGCVHTAEDGSRGRQAPG